MQFMTIYDSKSVNSIMNSEHHEDYLCSTYISSMFAYIQRKERISEYP